MQIAIASDPTGLEFMERLSAKLTAEGHQLAGPVSALDNGGRRDYAEKVALAVLRGGAERGIVISSRAVSASVLANRVPGIRAAVCSDPRTAFLGAKNAGMNVLVLSLHGVNDEQAQEIVSAYLEATLAPVEVVGGLTPRRLELVFAYVRENISKELAVQELARVVGMSQYYFSKLFKLSTGTTPHQYVMRLRVERAQELLRETDTPLTEIASTVGFETQSHFTSVFRKVSASTPKRYRELHQNNRTSDAPGAEQKAATAA